MNKDRVTTQALRAASLMQSSELKPLVDYLRGEYLARCEALVILDSASVANAQGYALALKDFLALVDSASSILAKRQT